MKESDFNKALIVKDKITKLSKLLEDMSNVPQEGLHSFSYKADIKDGVPLESITSFKLDESETKFLFHKLLLDREERLHNLEEEFEDIG